MIEDGWMFAFGKKKSNFVDFVDVIYRRLSMSILRLSTRLAVHSNQIKIEKIIFYILMGILALRVIRTIILI